MLKICICPALVDVGVKPASISARDMEREEEVGRGPIPEYIVLDLTYVSRINVKIIERI